MLHNSPRTRYVRMLLIRARKDDGMRGLLAAGDAAFRRVLLGKHARRRLSKFLDLIFAGAAAAPARPHEVALIDAVQKFIERLRRNDAALHARLGAQIQILLNVVEQRSNRSLRAFQGSFRLLMRIAAGKKKFPRLQIARAELDPHGNALHLPLVELPAGGIVRIVERNAHARFGKPTFQGAARFEHAGLFGSDGHDDRLHGRDDGRQHEAALIAVRHDDAADEAGGDAPRRRVAVFERAVLIGKLNVERLGEILPEVMAGARLPALPHTSAWTYGHILLPVPGPPPPDPVPGL